MTTTRLQLPTGMSDCLQNNHLFLGVYCPGDVQPLRSTLLEAYASGCLHRLGPRISDLKKRSRAPGGILIGPYTLLEVYTSAALHFWWSTLPMNFGSEEPLTKSLKSTGLVVYARGGLRYAGCTLKMGRNDHKQCRHKFLTQQLIS